MTAFVEPPIACSATTALANAPGVRMSRGRRPAPVTAPTISSPARRAAAADRGSPAGTELDPGTISPSTSLSTAIVDAVPIVLQAPRPQDRHRSSSRQPSSSSRPARRSSHSRHSAVPVPIARRGR